jgi:uncharacterized protein (UPF0179 family)
MVMMTMMTALCVVGVAFYVRFLVALCKECRIRRICNLVRLQSELDQYVIHKDKA